MDRVEKNVATKAGNGGVQNAVKSSVKTSSKSASKRSLETGARIGSPSPGHRGGRKASGEPAAPRSDRRTLDAIRAHVVAHLEDDLTLAALARRAGMSASCFSRWFRDQTGRTPHAFVLEARVARAKSLLQESDLPILEVALAVGFSSQSCLNVTFRRRDGLTPAEYRAGISKKTKDAPRGGVRRS
jgi:transcriptional regulator GlxA family with amidase domain